MVLFASRGASKFQSGKKRCYTPSIMYVYDIQSDSMQHKTPKQSKLLILQCKLCSRAQKSSKSSPSSSSTPQALPTLSGV